MNILWFVEFITFEGHPSHSDVLQGGVGVEESPALPIGEGDRPLPRSHSTEGDTSLAREREAVHDGARVCVGLQRDGELVERPGRDVRLLAERVRVRAWRRRPAQLVRCREWPLPGRFSSKSSSRSLSSSPMLSSLSTRDVGMGSRRPPSTSRGTRILVLA